MNRTVGLTLALLCVLVAMVGAGPHTSGEHGAGGSTQPPAGGMPPFLRLDLPLAFWTLVVFAVLLFVLKRFAWGPIMQALEQREKRIAQNLADAEKAHRDAQQLLEEHHQKLDLVQDEVRAILEEARRDAQHTSQEIVRKAEEESRATHERMLRDVERARDQALQDIAKTAADMVVNVAGRVIRRSLREPDHRRLIEEALAELGNGKRK
ncbi:MAG: F0F1 ATP synthase subunit B [Planctomycetes bacterium]|nr:F0F1 ATP synthase subunit B [Planctomycetota bacterium]